MNKSEKKRTKNEKHVLPLIVADCKVFTAMTKPEKNALYNSITEKVDNPKYLRGKSSWYNMLSNPVDNFNKPLLEGRRKNVALWEYLVNVFEKALTEHLKVSYELSVSKLEQINSDKKRVESHVSTLETFRKEYLNI